MIGTEQAAGHAQRHVVTGARDAVVRYADRTEGAQRLRVVAQQADVAGGRDAARVAAGAGGLRGRLGSMVAAGGAVPAQQALALDLRAALLRKAPRTRASGSTLRCLTRPWPGE